MKDQKLIRVIFSLFFFVMGFLLLKENDLSIGCFAFSYFIIGYDVIWNALKNCVRFQFLDETFLMMIATIGAFLIGEFAEGVAIMLFFQIGEYLQDRALNHSKKSIDHLMELNVDVATVIDKEEEQEIPASDVKVGDTIVVKPGERVALDGVVIDGKSNLDTRSITGESVPVQVTIGSQVMSGSINLEQVIKLRVVETYENSTVSNMIRMMKQMTESSAKTEKFITKFSKVYTPVIVLLAFFIATIPSLMTGDVTIWVHRALVFLVISCPCALVLSIPLGFFCCLGRASQYGILFKSSESIENLAESDIVLFDKTGTLTEGKFKVNKIIPESLSKDELLQIAAYAEHYSNHPIAHSIQEEYRKRIDTSILSSYREVSGYGIKVKIGPDQIMVGNEKMLEHVQIPVPEHKEVGTLVYFVINDKYAGMMVISDVLREDSQQLLSKLKDLGVERFVVLSGDHDSIVSNVAKQLEISEWYSGLLPVDKVKILKKIQKESETPVIFVGDGTNDALVLTAADVGVSMGGIGSAAAMEASDVVIMNDRISLLSTAISLSRRTKMIIWQNIIFAILLKIMILILGSLGIANIWFAVFSDVGVTILAILNSIRIFRIKIK